MGDGGGEKRNVALEITVDEGGSVGQTRTIRDRVTRV